MKLTQALAIACLSICFLPQAHAAEAGRTSYNIVPAPADPKLNNPWSAAAQDAFWNRAQESLDFWKGKKPSGGTYGENEKNFYPTAMMAFLTGDRASAIKAFEEDDNQAKDHAWTSGVDFYWCFTLKGQARKYFYFGGDLSPAYKQKFLAGAKAWTTTDPKDTKHPVYGDHRKIAQGEDWSPEAKGTAVDRRNTDNLRAMSDTTAYLMAEETGNQATREIYKQRINQYAQTLYNIGQSEWDSPNYHVHTLAPYHNLYDFAKDPEVKAQAKAVLDYLYAAAANKYFHGGFAGPNARDYGGNAPFAQNDMPTLWLYFADTPIPCPRSDRDDVYHITSSYRPPEAVVELAHKNFAKPAEIFASHPPYRNWKPGDDTAPEFFETTYIARTYQLGSLVSAGTGGPWNINAFKLLAYNPKRGADFFVVNTDGVLGHGFKRPGDQVAQYRNAVIWLRPAAPAKPFIFQLPADAVAQLDGDIWFVAMDQTFVALRPINLSPAAPTKVEGKKGEAGEASARYLKAESTGTTYSGFALEVGEAPAYADLDAFKKAISEKSKLDLSKLAQGTAALTTTTGQTLAITHNPRNEMPTVTRDNKPRDFVATKDRWRSADDTPSPITQPWMSGHLHVEAGGKTFDAKLDKDGKYTFENK